jgi:adenylate cyclase
LRPDDFAVLGLVPAALDAIGERARAEAVSVEAAEGLRHQVELDPDNVRALYMLASILARLGKRDAGMPYLERALQLRPDDYATLYNAACYYSLAGDTDRALTLLERACRSGGGNREWIERDNDLAALRGNPRFDALLARLESDAVATATSS